MSPRPRRDHDEPHGVDDRPSRSQRKREVAAITALGVRLVNLTPDALEALDLDDELRDAIERCRPLKRAARNRQTKWIGKLLRSRDHDGILRAVEGIQG